MSQFNYIGSGNPTSVIDASGQIANYLDTFNVSLWFNVGNGWVPDSAGLVSKKALLAQAANVSNVLTYAVLANGLYKVSLYEVSSNTPTAATLPAITVVYTDLDTAGSITDTLASVGSVSSAGVVNQGSFIVNAGVGTNIVIATTSYAAGSGTALSYNIKARIQYLG